MLVILKPLNNYLLPPCRLLPVWGFYLWATRKLGEISKKLEKAKVRGNQHTADVRVSDNGKTATLSSVGVSRQRANKAEKPAKIDGASFCQARGRGARGKPKTPNDWRPIPLFF